MIIYVYIQQIKYIRIIMINNNNKSQKAKTSLQKIIQDNISQLRMKNKVTQSDQFALDQQSEKQAQKLFDEIQIKSQEEAQESQQQQQHADEDEDEDEDEGNCNQQKGEQQNNKLENKIKSILKNSKFKIKIEQKSKRVSFADPDNEQNKQKDYIVLGATRRWNQKLKSPKKGKFDPQQRRTLIQNLNQCLLAQNLTYQSIINSMTEDDQKIPRNLQFWTKVCSILPDRSIVSSYKFLKRQLSTKNKGGDWKQSQVQLLEQLVQKYGRKWSMISKQMHRTAENIRDKYRQMGEQKYDPSKQQTIWKLQQLVKYLKQVQKYSKINFLKKQIQDELIKAEQHDRLQLKQMKLRKYNSKSFNFHNNQIVRKYINKQFNQIKMADINWQKISQKIQHKTIFDCRNKFVQLLQLEIYGLGSKQFIEKYISNFIISFKPHSQTQIPWEKWHHEDISIEQAKNRWMILKRHIQGRGQKTFPQLLELIKKRFNLN